MAEEVEIINVGNGGVASEETLVALLEVMKKLAKSKGFDPDEATKQIKDLADSTENLVDVVDDHTRALEENTEEVENNTSALGGAARWITSAFSQAATGAFMLGKELLVGGDQLSSFSQHIPFIGSLITPLALVLDNTINEFRDMTNYGIDFGESLLELRKAATESGLSFDTYSKIVRDNSESLALFGGSAKAGARIFTDVSRIVQRDFGPQFSALGMTMDQTAQYTADYLDAQRRMGVNERFNQQQLAAGTSSYIMMLDRLSKITGKQRDEIAESLKTQRTDSVINALLSTLEPAAQEALQSVLQVAETMSPEISQGMRDLIATGGVPISEAAQALALLNPEFKDLARGLNQGSTSSEEVFDAFRRTADASANMTKEEIDQLAILSEAGTGAARSMAEMRLKFMNFTTIAEDAAGALSDQQKAMERGNQGLLDFSRRITELRNEIVGRLIDSGIFQRLETAASGLVDMLTGPKGSAALKNAIDSIAGFLEEFMADIKTVGLWNAIRDNLLTGLSSIWEEIKLQLFGGTRDNTDKIKSTESRITSLQTERQNLTAQDKRGANVTPEQYETLDAAIQQLKAERDKLAQEHGKQIEGVLSGVSDSLLGMSEKQISDLKDQQMSALAEISALEVREQKGTISEEDTVRLAELRSEVAALNEELANSKGMLSGVGESLLGMTEQQISDLKDKQMSALAEISALEVREQQGTISETDTERLAELRTEVAALDDELANSQGMFGPILDNLGGIAGLLAGGVVAAGITAIGIALLAATPGALGFGAAIGMAAGGIGFALYGVSSIIESTAVLFEYLGNAVSKVIETLGIAAERIGTAVSAPIIASGEAIKGVIDSITAYSTAGIYATTDQIERLANIPGTNLVDAARGIELMKIALDGFEPGFWEGLGDWFTGGMRQDSMAATTGVIVDLAAAFSNINPEVIKSAATAIVAMSVALKAFNEATSIQGVGDLAGRLLGYQESATAISTLATSLQGIDGSNLENVAPGIVAVSQAVSQFQALTAIDSVSEGVSAALQSYIPLSNTVADVATRLSSIENPERLSAVSPAITELATALGQFQQLTAIDSISESISVALGSYSAATTPLIDLINSLSLIDGSTLKNAGPGIEAVSNALTVFKNSTGFQGIGDLVANWFSEDAMEIGTKIQTIANDLNQIDSSRLTSVSGSIVLMGNALQSFSSIKLEDISINNDFVEKLQTLSTLSTGLSSTATSLNEIASVNGIRDNLDAINQGLDASAVNTYASAIEKLVENLNDLNEVLSDSNDTFLKNNLSAAEVLGNITVTNQGNAEAVEELNIVMTEILSTLRQSNEYERRIERNTASLGSDITSGRVSTIR